MDRIGEEANLFFFSFIIPQLYIKKDPTLSHETNLYQINGQEYSTTYTCFNYNCFFFLSQKILYLFIAENDMNNF